MEHTVLDMAQRETGNSVEAYVGDLCMNRIADEEVKQNRFPPVESVLTDIMSRKFAGDV